jgi:WD40 repeat protein
MQEQKIVTTLIGHTDSVKDESFSPDGKQLASGCSDGSIKLWSIEKLREEFVLRGHSQAVNCLGFSKDPMILI